MTQTISAIGAWRRLLAEKLKSASTIVDATAGNGGDTLYLARHSKEDARIYAFDVQKTALDAVRRKLSEASLLAKTELILASHADMDLYVRENIDIAVFNLGYLPGGDHALTTLAETTAAALHKAAALLGENGAIAVVAYPGHAVGLTEERCLFACLTQFPAKFFTVGRYAMINHPNSPPVLYLIEKVRS